MKTNWFKSIAAAVIAAFTFAFAPSAWASVDYLVAVYNTPWDPADGIAYWDTRSVDTYTEVDEDTTVWYSGCYVVSGAVTIGERISCAGDVSLILKDGATLTATKGIEVSGDVSILRIYAQSTGAKMGALVATGSGSGIGSSGSAKVQYITINGGKITAKCTGLYGAGIGGGGGGSASDITINGGIVEATGHCGAGIGGGGDGVGEYITINGGKVTAIGGGGVGGAAGIGGGDNGGGQGRNITINGGYVTAIGGGYSGSAIGNGGNAREAAVDIYVSKSLVLKADGNSLPETKIYNRGGDLAGDLAGQRYATVTPPMTEVIPWEVEHTTVAVLTEDDEIVATSPFMVESHTTARVVYTADDGYVFADGSTTYVTEAFAVGSDTVWMPVSTPAAPIPLQEGIEYQRPVYVADYVAGGVAYWETSRVALYNVVTDQTTWGTAGQKTWYVVEGGVTINSRITCVGDVKLVLKDDATLTANAGITVSGDGNALTIYAQEGGTGTLVATSDAASNAGIGGTASKGGNITINGGIVTARGNTYAAGIGGGKGCAGHDITINGGTVTAKSANSDENPNAGWAAGIGGGDGGAGNNIVINGGTVDASCYASGSGIGGGGNGRGSWITINGGIVKAESGSNNGEWNGAGIGGGCNTGADNIYINGGYVEAIGGGGGDDPARFGSGIGGGRYASSSDTFVSTDLPLLADAEFSSPTAPLWNDGDDLSESLKGLRGVTAGTKPEEPAVEELVLWEGEAVVKDWNDPVTGSQPALITGGGDALKNAGAYVGQEIRFYITPTGEWNEEGYEDWWCDIVGGWWEGVYVQRCGIGSNRDHDPNRMEWDLDANGGYISFTLTQEMLDAAYRKGAGTGVFVANGSDAIITKIALVDPKPVTPVEPEEEHPAIDPDMSVYPYYWDDGMVLWEGEVLADEWKNSPYFFVNNAVEVLDAEGVSAKEGDEIRFYITPTEGSWACEIWKGDWSGAYVSYNSDEWDLEANGGYISLTLTQEMLEFAYTKESWSGLFIANADNVVVTKIVHVDNDEDEVKDYPAYISDDDEVKAKYDAWVEAFCIADRVDSDAALQNAYLLNVAPADAERAMAEFRITSITVNADGTVTVTTPEGKNYNGTVEIIGAETLDGDYTAAKVWYNTARFFKAILK